MGMMGSGCGPVWMVVAPASVMLLPTGATQLRVLVLEHEQGSRLHLSIRQPMHVLCDDFVQKRSRLHALRLQCLCVFDSV